jgi:hypothetical protein
MNMFPLAVVCLLLYGCASIDELRDFAAGDPSTWQKYGEPKKVELPLASEVEAESPPPL